VTTWAAPLSVPLTRGMRVRVDGEHEGVIVGFRRVRVWDGRRPLLIGFVVVRLTDGNVWRAQASRIEAKQRRASSSGAFPAASTRPIDTQEG